MNKNELKWFYVMQHMDSLVPLALLEGAVVYTVFLKDFFKMSNVDFIAESEVDRNLKALFN